MKDYSVFSPAQQAMLAALDTHKDRVNKLADEVAASSKFSLLDVRLAVLLLLAEGASPATLAIEDVLYLLNEMEEKPSEA